MADYPRPAAASSLWTFGRETPVDGDSLAFTLLWDRKYRDYFRGLATELVNGSEK